jgi:monoamine oxidase
MAKSTRNNHRNKNKQAASSKLPTSSATMTKGSVIVVGAGLAGLAAACRLVQRGHDRVLVLEGRHDRVGGRIWTITSRGADAGKGHDDDDDERPLPGAVVVPLDLGATWIHGTTGNPLTNVAETIGAHLRYTSYHRSTVYDMSTGRTLSADQQDHLESVKKQLLQLVRQAQDHDTDVSIRSAVEPLLRQYDIMSEERRFIEFLLQSELETEYAGGVDELSTYWHDSDKEYGGGDALLAQGYQVIVDHLADGLHIELGQVVTEIHWQEDSSSSSSSPAARVVTNRAEFTADHVIVTVPLGVLQQQKIHFSPPLPRRVEQAIAKLGMGVLNKCCLHFAEPFWSDKIDWFECVAAPAASGEGGMWTEWVSLLRVLDAPVLMGFSAAQRAREIEHWTDEETEASAMQTLRTIFGPNIPDPVNVQITRWAIDPFSCGSYSFNAVGSQPNMRKTLAAPIAAGRVLFFAGEATDHRYFGTVHGAYLSGIRVAGDVAGN